MAVVKTARHYVFAKSVFFCLPFFFVFRIKVQWMLPIVPTHYEYLHIMAFGNLILDIIEYVCRVVC